MTEEGFARARAAGLGLTGVVCVAYAVTILALGRPDATWNWIPGMVGLLAAAFSAWLARRAPEAARRASDEGYAADWQRAQRQAFWIALLLFPAGSVAVQFGLVDGAQALAMGGVLSAGAVLLLAVFHDLRGR